MKRSSGFTLIELLGGVAIMGVLAALLFPAFARARSQARRASCQSNLKQIGVAHRLYLDDWDGQLPTVEKEVGSTRSTRRSWARLIMPYLKTEKVFVCPANVDGVFSYGYNYFLVQYAWAPDAPQGKLPATAHPVEKVETQPDSVLLAFDAPNGEDRFWGFTGEWDHKGECYRPDLGDQKFCDGDLVDEESWRLMPPEAGDWLKPRHDGFNNLLFLDGHVKSLRTISDDMDIVRS
jgi:prepilin-type processing-associated H-X9-DG protein/prepilin-type N-terminal cleavage/methylation domain-containing protein